MSVVGVAVFATFISATESTRPFSIRDLRLKYESTTTDLHARSPCKSMWACYEAHPTKLVQTAYPLEMKDSSDRSYSLLSLFFKACE